jgi:hypothetical protein
MILQKVEQNAPLDELLFSILVFCVLLITLAGLVGYLTNEELDYGLRVRLSNHFTVLATEKACTTSYPNTLRANYWETCDRSIYCIGVYDHGCSYMIGSVGKLFQAILGFGLYLLLLSNLDPVLLILVIVTTVIGYFVSRKINVAACSTYDQARVIDSLGKSGFGDKLKTLPNGLDTYLYNQLKEDGVSVSGGEAQKIAIARALYKDSPFLILDEPTAALDPIAEAEIYSNLNKIIDDKTAIYISHRLSSCRFCDDILVFHEGNVVQHGSHEALVADVAGKYFELWNAQAQYYT